MGTYEFVTLTGTLASLYVNKSLEPRHIKEHLFLNNSTGSNCFDYKTRDDVKAFLVSGRWFFLSLHRLFMVWRHHLSIRTFRANHERNSCCKSASKMLHHKHYIESEDKEVRSFTPSNTNLSYLSLLLNRKNECEIREFSMENSLNCKIPYLSGLCTKFFFLFGWWMVLFI